MTRADAEKLKREISNGYSERLTKGPKDYPPYALTPWDDRIRFQAWVFKLIDEMVLQ